MSNFGSDDIVIVFDNSAGTTVNVSQSILELNGVDVEAMLEESHTFGDSWVENLPVGVNKVGDITMKGFYDDDADTGFNFMFKNVGETRTFAVTWGSTKITTVEAVIKNYRRLPSRGELTKAEAVLETAYEAAEDGLDEAHSYLKRQWRQRPVAVAATVLGVGMLIGIALGSRR